MRRDDADKQPACEGYNTELIRKFSMTFRFTFAKLGQEDEFLIQQGGTLICIKPWIYSHKRRSSQDQSLRFCFSPKFYVSQHFNENYVYFDEMSTILLTSSRPMIEFGILLESRK